jgi:hypothetical protein
MKRRELLQNMGIAALGTVITNAVAGEPAQRSTEMISASRESPPEPTALTLGNAHFLSATNPLATVDQRGMEKLGLDILATPVVQNARAQAAMRFQLLAGPDLSAEALHNFEAMMEECAFHYVMVAVNSDPDYPKVQHNNFGPPHEWFGIKVPGSRGPGCGDNADNNYAMVPIDHHAHFEIHGQRMEPATGDYSFNTTGTISLTNNIAFLGKDDIEVNSDGNFVITIGPEPAGGRRNHLQTTLDTHYLCIRDTRVDWREVPNAYRVYRREPPAGPPQTKDQLAKVAARFIIDDVGLNFANAKMLGAGEINAFSQPANSAALGGMSTQSTAKGRLKLADDDAFVLHFYPEGAGYHIVTTNDTWFATSNYWDYQQTLNNTQAIPNNDGSYTYVIAGKDPGVHNWIDTAGLSDMIIVLRIQLLPKNPDGTHGGKEHTRGQLVKLDDLRAVLPKETRWISSRQRSEQLAYRLEQFNLRYVDR